jgi:hypothetical protein
MVVWTAVTGIAALLALAWSITLTFDPTLPASINRAVHERHSVAVEALKPGDCVSYQEGDVDKFTNSRLSGWAFHLGSCNETHQLEVYANLVIPSDAEQAWPGVDAAVTKLMPHCDSYFRAYVGSDPKTTTLHNAILGPSAASWGAGDRRVICLVNAEHGLIGSVKGSKM